MNVYLTPSSSIAREARCEINIHVTRCVARKPHAADFQTFLDAECTGINKIHTWNVKFIPQAIDSISATPRGNRPKYFWWTIKWQRVGTSFSAGSSAERFSKQSELLEFSHGHSVALSTSQSHEVEIWRNGDFEGLSST